MDKLKVQEAVKDLLKAIGEDPNREGLVDTPRRVADMYEEILHQEEVDYKMFSQEGQHRDGLVVVKDIEFSSMCEHHLLPFVGTVSIGYYPYKKVMGLSKLARVVEKFSHKLQLQEQMMNEILEELQEELGIEDVAVVINAKHYCMISRGVKQRNSSTVTTKYGGKFKVDSNKSEFLSIVKGEF